MVVSGYSTDDYKSPKISIREIMKYPELLKFIPDQLKTKKMCKHAVKMTFCNKICSRSVSI